jgi:hypothetical protein
MMTFRYSTILHPVSLSLSCVMFLTSCYTTSYVNDHSRPIYEEKKEPVYGQVDKTEYRKIPNPVFRDQYQKVVEKPIDLAVLDFWNVTGESYSYYPTHTKSFYNKLIKYPGIWDKFQPYSPDNIKAIYRFDELHPNNRRLFNELSKGGIPFFVTGQITDSGNPEFWLSIYRTSDGATMLNHKMRTTDASNAYEDAVRLLIKEELPDYLSEHKIVRYDTKKEITGYHKKQVSEYEDTTTWVAIIVLLIAGIVALN